MRTLSREGDAATVTRRRTDVPQWYQGAGMNGSDLEKIAIYEGGVFGKHSPTNDWDTNAVCMGGR